MRFATRWKPIEAWAQRHRFVLSAAGYALALAVMFGGVALAAYHSGFTQTEAAVCSALAIFFIRFFARRIPAGQRLIDRLHPPEQDAPAKPDELPGWALAVYALIGLALVLAIIAFEKTHPHAVIALFVGWSAGHHLLEGLVAKRDGTTAFGTAFIAFDERLDAWRDRHWAVLRVLGTVLGFVLLFGAVALHASESGLVHALGVRCGSTCSALPGVAYLAAAACGAAAILFVKLYAALTGGVQRKFIDPWKYVRPEPAPREVARWAVVLHVLIGFVVFFAIASFGHAEASGPFHMSIGDRITLDGRALLELILGWWIGGRGVLQFFWPQP